MSHADSAIDPGSAGAVDIHYELVTPSRAAALLRAGGVDPLGVGPPKAVLDLGADMLAGRWILNGSPIVIAADDTILNGRRRLAASVRCRSDFPTYVVSRIDPSVSITVDAHKRRTARDLLAISGVAGAGEKGAAAVILRALASPIGSYDGGTMAATPRLVEEIVEMHPGLADSILAAKEINRHVRIGKAVLAAIHYAVMIADPPKGKAFFEQMAKRSRNPAIRALKLEIQAQATVGGKTSRRIQAGCLVKAWNAYRNGVVDPDVGMTASENVPRISGDPVIEMPLLRDRPDPLDEAERRRIYREPSRAARSRIRAFVRTFMPAEAEEILRTRNGPLHVGRNRPVSKQKARMFCRDMIDGAWVLNGDTVKFGVSGRLIDGQHRLTGCATSGAPFTTLVVEGLDDGVFRTIDSGVQRQFRSVLKDMKVPNHSLVADVIGTLWRYDTGRLGGHEQPSQTEGLRIYDKMKTRIAESSCKFKSNVRLVMTEGQATYLHIMLSAVNSEHADNFMSDLIVGAGLEAGDPVLALRTAFMTRAGKVVGREDSGSGMRLRERHVVKLAFKAWNLRRAGKKQRSGLMTSSEDEPIPVLI